MSARTPEQQLIRYLADAHAIEEQALVQLRRAPALAGDALVASIYREHLGQTSEHEHAVRQALSLRGASTSAIKEAVTRAGGLGFVLFARFQGDTPAKLASDVYSYEHLELASYELLRRVADAAGDRPVAELAVQIGAQESAMGERLAHNFDRTAHATLAGGDAAERLSVLLADAHAIEAQSITLLDRALKIVHEPDLADVFAEHLVQSREHMALLEGRLAELGARPSVAQDAAMRRGAASWGTFFQAQPDTPGRLAAFAYAFEHLEIGGYEHLHRAAEAAKEPATALLAEAIVEQERAAAGQIAGCFDAAASASLIAPA